MTTIAPIDNRIVKKQPNRFPNLFPDIQVSNLEVDTLTANVIQGTGGGILTVDSDLQVNGGFECQNGITTGNLTMMATGNKLVLNGLSPLSTTSGGIANRHISVLIDGVNYKIELRNP